MTVHASSADDNHLSLSRIAQCRNFLVDMKNLGHITRQKYREGRGFAVGIWLSGRDGVTEDIVVWIANRDDAPVSSSATINFTTDGKLVVYEHGEVKAIAEMPEAVTAASASMLDSGSFMLYYNQSKVIWESFQGLESPCANRGYCGLNSYCSKIGLSGNCTCFPGFVQHSNSPDCYPGFLDEGACQGKDSELSYSMTEIENINWGGNPYAVISASIGKLYQALHGTAHHALNGEFALRFFSYAELEKATNGFKEILGTSSFGAVYKGTLSEFNKCIAMKSLENVAVGETKFRAEMMAVGQTHHRNLVQLLGFCIEGSRKLLVYEFMKCGSLADYLFKMVVLPHWNERVRIALDVARGILYLHEEWVKRITSGYMPPEWQKTSLITERADIYSFGVVLLEIIYCRSMELNVPVADGALRFQWVYSCFLTNNLKNLVGDEEADVKVLERMVKVGLLFCNEECDPDIRRNHGYARSSILEDS
ncbi:hypothetical protein C2S52_007863 [Perilla frutescens var. hirtella]|nr:hypothetical protein C2S52_007863 [Perilla frutescens var. hirtella]